MMMHFGLPGSRIAISDPVSWITIDNLPEISANYGVEVADNASEAQLRMLSVQRAMATLPDEQRLAVALVLVEGLSYKEAAEALEIPIGTLTSRLARGREALQKQLE